MSNCVSFVSKFEKQPYRFLFYFTSASVKCREAVVKRLPVLYHSADYIFISFGLIIEPILVTLKTNVP